MIGRPTFPIGSAGFVVAVLTALGGASIAAIAGVITAVIPIDVSTGMGSGPFGRDRLGEAHGRSAKHRAEHQDERQFHRAPHDRHTERVQQSQSQGAG
jgi:hypothetical protein